MPEQIPEVGSSSRPLYLDKRLLRLTCQAPFLLAAVIGLGLLGGLLTLYQAWLVSQGIARLFLGGKGLSQVAGILALVPGIFLLRAGLHWAGESAAAEVARRVKISLRRQLLERLFALGPAYTRGERSGELTHTLAQGVEALDAYYRQYLPQLALAALLPLTFLTFIFPLDPLSGLVLLLTAPLIPLFMSLIGGLAQAATRRQWLTLSRLSAYFLDLLQGLATLKVFGRSQAQVQVVDQASQRYRQATMNVLRVTFLSALALEMVATLSTALVAVEVGLRLLAGRLAFEQAFFVLLLAPEFYQPLRSLGARFHAGMSAVAAAARIFQLLDEPAEPRVEIPLPSPSVNPPSQPDRPIALRFANVHYAYPDGQVALHSVTFEIHPGEVVAMVGPSGAGKTTVAHLLLRFIQPQAGEIWVDGRRLDRIPIEEWRARVAWVPQSPYLFNDTVAANIRLTNPQADLEAVIRAARMANAHEFVQALPQGYDTIIGERGTRLSAGQAQRIALARAFLKQAPVVILDEAAANLDPENEALLADALKRLLCGRTALLIAHRLNTARCAHRVIVLQDGHVVESGTHPDLLRAEGLYRRMARAYAAESDDRPRQFPLLASVERTPFAPPPPDRDAQQDEGVFDTPSQSLSPFRRLLGFVASYKGGVGLSLLMGAVTYLSSVGLMSTSAYLISLAALQPSIAVLQVPIVAVRFFGLSRGVFRYLERLTSHQTTFQLLARLRVWFYAALEPLAPARLMRCRSGDLLTRILEDIESLENFYLRVIAPPGAAVLVALGVAWLLGQYATRLAWLYLVFLIFTGAGLSFVFFWLGRRSGQELIVRRAALNASLVDAIQGMPDLLICGRAKQQLEVVNRLSREVDEIHARLERLNGLQAAMILCLSNLAAWTVLAQSAALVNAGVISGVYLAVLYLAVLFGFEALLPLPQAAALLESNLQAARRLFNLVDARPEVVDHPQPLPLPQFTSLAPMNTASPQERPASRHERRSSRGDILLDVRRLSFRYPPPLDVPSPLNAFQPDALQDVSFSLPRCGRVAVVGPSGAGKTTLVHLLLRFWDYSQGQILLCGEDLRRYRQEQVRGLIGLVSQHTYLFNATVRENLLLARPTASEDELIEAARMAQLHDRIQSLPQGYNTWIGEQGFRLSAGERQRLAIARALLKDAPLLILDEATANLDSLTEQQIIAMLQRISGGRSLLMVTHRLVGLESVDEIIVLRQGQVVERGTHESLLAVDGFYRRMWELQSQVLLD